ncbi:preprotein translocase subunit SecY [Candidatus Poribacteria bacterium]|nr:preprotein translocase subunit SecY [Candidatus Poribacteria bacterium]
MIQALQNAWKLPDIRRRILFTMGILIVYRLGSYVFLPGVDQAALEAAWERISGNLGALKVVNVFSGGNFEQMTIFALGIQPYISASIILQLLTVVVPHLEQLAKEGTTGRRKITQYTRYGTIGLSAFQSLGISAALTNPQAFGLEQAIVPDPSLGFYLMTMLTLTAGTTFVMWLGEQIEEYGIGQGISLIIFIGIVANVPAGVAHIVGYMTNPEVGGFGLIGVVAIILAALAIIVGTIYITLAERRIPVQYAKRIVGRRMYGGQTQYLPLKVNMAGVMPIIFAITIMQFPAALMSLPLGLGIQQALATLFSPGPIYYTIYALLIVFFTYFYTAVVMNPVDVADNLKKHGGFIPGQRPGRTTAKYIDRTLSRVTLPGAIFLAAIAIVPFWFVEAVSGDQLQLSGIGGTSILIVVGVALDRMQWLDAQLRTHNYEGLLKGQKVKGRR